MHIWDLDLKREAEGVPEAKRARGTLPKELMLTHAGHRAPVCAARTWAAGSPWGSVSAAVLLEHGRPAVHGLSLKELNVHR